MKSLNPKQQEAVENTDGKILILAGAGSGKTSVIIARIIHLIEKKNIDPDSILGLTFTNKAAREMQERLASFIGKYKASKVKLCTFHSYCFHLLKETIHHLGYTGQFSIYDEKDIKRIITQIMKNHINESENIPSIEAIFNMIKNKEPIEGFCEKKIQEIKDELMRSLKTYNAIDFDGLIDLTIELFENHPEVLKREQKHFQYIMIDEYQDTNPAQYRLASLLCAHYNNLCVVGDDDQSIYGWRGAEIKHILQFPYDTIIKLEQNYRSTNQILTCANTVIKNNQDRHDKTLWSLQSKGYKVQVFHAPSEEDEADAIIQRLIELKQEKQLKWSDMAILYRSNNLSKPFEAKLIQAVWQKGVDWIRGIPYQIVQGTEFYERAEIKDIVAYLKAIVNPQDQEAMLRIINYPRRGISTKTLEKITKYNRLHNICLWDVLLKITNRGLLPFELTPSAVAGIELFVALIHEGQTRFHNESFDKAFEWLIHSIGYHETIKAEFKDEKTQSYKWENVVTIKQMLMDYEANYPDNSLHDFLSDSMLDSDKYDKIKRKNPDCVQLMTFHSAKGLEFDACFLVGLEDSILPHEKSLAQTGIEEERRLFYVALTRAKKFLTLSMSRNRKRHGKQKPSNPSRFLFELPKENLLMTQWNFPQPFLDQSDG